MGVGLLFAGWGETKMFWIQRLMHPVNLDMTAPSVDILGKKITELYTLTE